MKLILDLDTGIDDALALAYVIAKETELLGITSVYGNVDVDQATKNTLGLLHLLGRSDIPVFKGAAAARGTTQYEQKRGSQIFHGTNGLADLDLEIQAETPEEMDASDFIIESVKKYGCDLKIVATGPLTNIANAIKKAPETMKQVKEIVIMGGALTVPGNVSPFAEANIAQDPLAADCLFKSGIPVIMIGLDVTLRTLLTRDEIISWKDGNLKESTYYKIIDFYLKAHELISPALGGCAIHDPLAAAVALYPDFIKTYPLCLEVKTGEQSGRTTMDLSAMNNVSNKNVKVALDVDVEAFKQDFLASINKLMLS